MQRFRSISRPCGGTTLKATHGAGFGNMGIYLPKERRLNETDGVGLELEFEFVFVFVPPNTEITTMFGAASWTSR